MESIEAYLLLFGVVIVVGQLFNRSTIPVALLLVITGMLLSFFPFIPRLDLSPTLVLNVFLPLLVYEISAYSSWGDFKKNIRPIALLSVGHVIFIALLIAIVIHALLPELGWP